MHKFLTNFGFIRINQTTWRWQDGDVDLIVTKEMIGSDEFVRLTDGPGNVEYWQSKTLGLHWVELDAAIRKAERKQRG
jgi:hypothetical protein